MTNTNLHKAIINNDRKASSLTDSYTIVSVGDAIAPLLGSGYSVLKTVVPKARSAEREGLQKHLVQLAKTEHVEAYNRREATLAQFPTLNILNSHDGTTALRIEFGVFRMICANGLWAGNSVETYRLVHRGSSLQERVNDLIPAIAAQSDKVMANVERLTQYVPNDRELEFLALEALRLRDPVSFNNLGDRELEHVAHWLTHSNRRYEDARSDLWTVFNRIQEFTIRGSKNARGGNVRLPKFDLETGRVEAKTWRAVSSLDKSRAINKGLWEAAEYILEGKVA